MPLFCTTCNDWPDNCIGECAATLVERTRCTGCGINPANMDDFCARCTARVIESELRGTKMDAQQFIDEEYPEAWRAELRLELAAIRREVAAAQVAA